MRLDRLEGVMRTRWVIAAARSEHRAQHELVSTDQQFQDGAHVLATRCQRVARLARNVIAGAPAAGNFAPTTMSTAGSPCCASRKDSRTSLRSRLRATALPAVFTATARPTRANARPLGLTRSAKKRSSMRRPAA